MKSIYNPSSLRKVEKAKTNLFVEGIDKSMQELTQRNCMLCIHVKGCPIYGITKMHIEPNTDAIKAEQMAYICKQYEEIQTTND